MIRRVTMLLLPAILLLAAPAAAQPSGVQLHDFGQLEGIALRVLTEGHIRDGGRLVPVDATVPNELNLVVPALEGELGFPALTSSLEKERELFDRYVSAYDAAMAAAVADGRQLMEEHELVSASWLKYSDGKLLQQFAGRYRPGKRAPRAAAASEAATTAFIELQAVLPAMFPRYADVYQKKQLKGAQIHQLLKEREARAQQYLKRYNLGPGLVETELQGSALLWVKLAPSVRQIAEDYLTAMKAPAVLDPEGNPMTWEGRKLHYLPAGKLLPELSKALDELTGEFFVVRYAVKEGDKVTDIMRLTGARLFLGEFYFVEYDDQLIVVRK